MCDLARILALLHTKQARILKMLSSFNHDAQHRMTRKKKNPNRFHGPGHSVLTGSF
jgi:hypothetical protein